MRRLALLTILSISSIACATALESLPFGERSSGALLSFEANGTETTEPLMAYDPTQHSMDISITLPLDQGDDIDIFIVTSSGVRFQILESFQDCIQNATGRHCNRALPVLPDEPIDNWRVEAMREDTGRQSDVEIAVTWVPRGERR